MARPDPTAERRLPSRPPGPQSRPPSPPGGPAAPGPRVTWLPWLILALLIGVTWVWQGLSAQHRELPPITYTQFYGLVEQGKVESIVLAGQTVTGHLKSAESVDGRVITDFRTYVPQDDTGLLPLLRQNDVNVTVRSGEQPLGVQILLSLLPWVLIIAVWFWLSQRVQRMLPTGGPLGGILRGRARRFDVQENVRVRFDDVAGLKSAKQDLTEIVDFLREPERFRRLGGKIPRGVLLVGPPGTGKTLLGRAVAGEAGVPFFSINGSEFIELFVGVGASRVRNLFEEAKKAAPAIIFIDEIDAVGRVRGTGLGGGNDEREQTLNQLLSEMDGFSRTDQVIVLAATNRPDVLDPALLRPGRFDRRVIIDRPESAARLAILQVHTRGKPLAPDVSLEDVAGTTPGLSGADLANLVNEAALSATRRGADAIAAVDFSAAYDKIILGDPREGRLSEIEKHRVAVHESGHAIVAHFTPEAEPLRRVTILPRGMSLGMTQQHLAEDRHLATQGEIEAKLAVLLGGYAAELVAFGNLSSGSENDLREATELAFKMVAHFGMSDQLGPIYLEHHLEHPFLGQRLAREGGISDQTVHAIETDARAVLGRALGVARNTISEHRDGLDRLVAALLRDETIDRPGLVALLGPPRPGPSPSLVDSETLGLPS